MCLSGTPPKSIVLDPIAWVCTTSLYRWMTKESWAKVDQKHFPPTMFHHRLCPSLPCFPQADIPSAVRPSIAVRLTKSRATSLFLQGPKNSQFSATGSWIRLSFSSFRPFLVWNAQWTGCEFLPNDVKGRGLMLTHIPPSSLQRASFARMLSDWCKAHLSFWMIMLISIIESREMHRIGHEWLHNKARESWRVAIRLRSHSHLRKLILWKRRIRSYWY